MGTPLPPLEVVSGVLCPIAWGPDKPFEEPTPAQITIQLHDTIEGQAFDPAWASQLFSTQILTQTMIDPCEFTLNTLNFTWGWTFFAGFTFVQVFVRFSPFLQAFLAGPFGLGLTRVDNVVDDDAFAVLVGGYAEITFGAP